MWTMHDFPAYGAVAGRVTNGYKACPICGPNTTSRYSVALKKTVYGCQHRRWLPLQHPMRHDVASFDGLPEVQPTPVPVSVDDAIAWGRRRQLFVQVGGHPPREDPRHIHGVKRVPIFFVLPYWKVRVHQPLLLCCNLALHFHVFLYWT